MLPSDGQWPIMGWIIIFRLALISNVALIIPESFKTRVLAFVYFFAVCLVIIRLDWLINTSGLSLISFSANCYYFLLINGLIV